MRTRANIAFAAAVLVAVGFGSLLAIAQQASLPSAEQRLRAAISNSGAADAAALDAELKSVIERIEDLKQTIEDAWANGEEDGIATVEAAYEDAKAEANRIFDRVRVSPNNIDSMMNYGPWLESTKNPDFVIATDYWKNKSPKPPPLSGRTRSLVDSGDRIAISDAIDRVSEYRDQINDASESNDLSEASRLYRESIQLLVDIFGLDGPDVWDQRQEFAQFLVDQERPEAALDQLWPLHNAMAAAGASQSDLTEVRSIILEAGESIQWRSAMQKVPGSGLSGVMTGDLAQMNAIPARSYSCRPDFMEGMIRGRDVAVKCANGKIVSGPDLSILESGFNCANFDIAASDLVVDPLGLAYRKVDYAGEVEDGTTKSKTMTATINILEMGGTRYLGRLLVEYPNAPDQAVDVRSNGFCEAKAIPGQSK